MRNFASAKQNKIRYCSYKWYTHKFCTLLYIETHQNTQIGNEYDRITHRPPGA